MTTLAVDQSKLAPYPLTEYLPYALAVEDGVLLCKDGGLMKSYWLETADLTLLAEHQQDEITLALARGMCALAEGWSFHADFIRATRQPPAPDTFPDPVSQMIDDSRVARYREERSAFAEDLCLTLRWTPPLNLEGRVKTLLTRAVAKRDTGAAMRHRFDEFRANCDMFEDAVAGAVALEPMLPVSVPGSPLIDFQLSHVSECLNGERRAIPVFPGGFYADCQIATEPMWFGPRPRINGKHIAVLAFDGFPRETQPAMLQTVAGVPLEMRWSSRFVMHTREKSRTLLKKQRQLWEQGSRSFVAQYLNQNPMDARQREGMAMMAELDDAMVEMASNADVVRYGEVSTVILLRHAEPAVLQEQVRSLRAQLNESGVVSRVEDINATEAVLGSLPGDVKHNIRRPLLHTLHYLNMLPLATTWAGSAYCPSDLVQNGDGRPLARVSGRGRVAFDLNLHVGDLGHTLIFGTTGSGKSVLLAFLAAQWRRYPQARVVCFDKGQSMRALTLGVGGFWRNLAPDEQGFAPFKALTAHDAALTEEDKLWAGEWIAALVQLAEGRKPNTHETRRITEGVNTLAEPGADRSLSALFSAVQDEAVQGVLGNYANTGRYASIFDTYDDDSDTGYNADFLCYEMEDLLSLPEEVVLPLLSFLFHQIARRATGEPTLVLLDEAWALLGHPVFKEAIREWLKTMRKKNVAVVMATQSLSDASRSGMVDVLAESCPTRIYGANSQARQTGMLEHYLQLGLGDADLQIVANLRAKREYYLTAANQARVINLDLGRKELAWLGTSDPASIAELLKLQETQPESWREQWTNH